ncbi:MAG: class I tRNA ligase family protein, partial [Thermoplasmata archaeon]|nr:class I tRNA ligase family protein [Thermoplasmata archaeon]
MKEYNPASIENKWQDRWEQSGIWKAEIDPDKEKFYLMFAYPGVSGYLHVGHMRGYTYSDVITRYKRMTGYNVLFPVGAHATGNVAITFARKVERGDSEQIEMLKSNGCTDETIEKLKDPEFVVEFFSQMYVNDYWKKFGFLADWRRYMTTIDPGYKKFIQWQFRKLDEKKMLTQKPYYGTACMNCGPVAVDASETDISKGGNAEKLEWTLLKFEMDGEFV